jgi:hypothetical protein
VHQSGACCRQQGHGWRQQRTSELPRGVVQPPVRHTTSHGDRQRPLRVQHTDSELGTGCKVLQLAATTHRLAWQRRQPCAVSYLTSSCDLHGQHAPLHRHPRTATHTPCTEQGSTSCHHSRSRHVQLRGSTVGLSPSAPFGGDKPSANTCFTSPQSDTTSTRQSTRDCGGCGVSLALLDGGMSLALLDRGFVELLGGSAGGIQGMT